MASVHTNSVRVFKAYTERIVTPVAVDARVDLGFGVHVSRRICVGNVPFVDNDYWEDAKHCFVILLGKKHFLVYMDSTVNTPIVPDARIYIPAMNGPPEFMEDIEGQRLLNVGLYMHWLSRAGPRPFHVKYVKEHTRGSAEQKEHVSP
jgi:hypothetical protein